MKARARLIFSQLVVALLVLVLGTLAPLAHASAPDPSWISGIYDGADYDDVVVLITFATGVVSPLRLADLEPMLQVVGSLAQLPERAPVSLSAAAFRPRGPPAS
jgi:Na+-transporting NADH:ubiquinone oxidoreductase subunit NqrD